jgi:hypothetical protein
MERFCGLFRLPTDRTLSRWLSRGKAPVRAALLALNLELIGDILRPFELRRLTVDVDGTVLSTGLQVERAFRGFNPHHRKVPSYYPITAHLAQTGHVLSVRNRSGNVHDGKASRPFLRDLFAQLEEMFPRTLLEVRLDGAFFHREILSWLESRAEYTVKVPFYHWLELQALIQQRRRWQRVAPDIEGFQTRLWLEPWKRHLQIAIYRKKVWHKTRKNYQLDLFDPTDGYWEYSAIATNKTLKLPALWHFMAGRGAQEKVIGQLKNGYAFDAIPTQNFAANSTWQILSTLAYNLITNFQIATGAPRRRSNGKRSPLFTLKNVHTLRYELFNRAGILQHPQGRATLSLPPNLPAQNLFQRILEKLRPAA